MLNLVNVLYIYLTCNILTPFLALHPEMFISNLKYMGLGMLCIIIVMAVIICAVLVMNKITAISAKKKSENNENE